MSSSDPHAPIPTTSATGSSDNIIFLDRVLVIDSWGVGKYNVLMNQEETNTREQMAMRHERLYTYRLVRVACKMFIFLFLLSIAVLISVIGCSVCPAPLMAVIILAVILPTIICIYNIIVKNAARPMDSEQGK